ncbi:zinc finger MYM-type protein 1-like, partial [Myzus persicae]|uniref:zinc finger MYM-type protein 1-like n=1 Tax=Myzus persicae TaxID=13164 RepID=UPI000B93469D
MAGRERDMFRKYESGSAKRQKKRKNEEFINKQRGSINRFISLKRDDSDGDKSLKSDNNDEENNLKSNKEGESSKNEKDNLDADEDKLFKSDDNTEKNNLKSDEEGQLTIYNLDEWKDPGNWPNNISQEVKYKIVELGPTHLKIFDFPATIQSDGSQRKFSPKLFYRILANNEKVDRVWLVYSPIKDCVFCFCCKIFINEKCHSDLATVGISDWRHVSDKLISHERSQHHVQSVKSWFELKTRIEMDETIDKKHQALFEKEQNHWRNVLIRILSIIQFLASNNDSFREMLAKFDPVILEHVNRIKNKETHVHYLGHEIQDELIKMMAAEVKKKIIDSIKTAKYFSIIMDTTPDISHIEQLTILIRIVNMDEKNTKSAPAIKEYFLDFINVKSTTGLHLSEILISQLKIYNIDLKDCRGQAYDNGSNMVGQYKGVQSRISNINSRAFFTPCTAHSLNLVLCDAAKNSLRAITFFGILRRVYTLFSASVSRWDILK